MVDQEMVVIGEQHLRRQAVLIEQPDPVTRGSFIKAKTHRRADARGLTANELGERQARREARYEADRARVAEQDFIRQLQYATADDTQLSTITVAPWPRQRPTTPIPSS